ncbi:hypothetical protein FD733_16670 [Pantoea sp. Eser]|nr:hypothetical protein [Pantoea sp. Eser]
MLRPGERVSREAIRPQRGSPEHLSSGLIYDPLRVIGRVALRAIHLGENLVESQLRQHWAIVAGEKVAVSYQGDSFTVHAAAKARRWIMPHWHSIYGCRPRPVRSSPPRRLPRARPP